MTFEYLQSLNSAVFAADGTATVVVGPSSPSEWWAPTYVRVSVRNTGSTRPSCVVYRGAPGIIDASTYLDDTLFGVNDTTSIIAGQTVQFGEKITAVFRGGTPNAVAILSVNGRMSDLPPSQGESLPSVPGTRFIGHITVQELGVTSFPTGASSASISVPSNEVWEIVSANLNFTTSATVANRRAVLQFTDSTARLISIAISNIDQPASVSRNYVFVAGMGVQPLDALGGPSENWIQVSMASIILSPTDVVSFAPTNRVAGDQVTASSRVRYRKYPLAIS